MLFSVGVEMRPRGLEIRTIALRSLVNMDPMVAKGVSLGDGANSVFTGGGTALVIHAKGDDNKTDPSGNSGDRIACGVITK